MTARNNGKARESENATAKVLRSAGMIHAERRTKRGGNVQLACPKCHGSDVGQAPGDWWGCPHCEGEGVVTVPADAGDITGIPGVVVQVKWSGYNPLGKDMARTDEQRQAANADIGLLVRKRPGVGCERAAEWDAFLPTWQVAILLGCPVEDAWDHPDAQAVWRTDLGTAARLISAAGYGTPEVDG